MTTKKPTKQEELVLTNYIEITKNTIDNIDLHMDCLQSLVSSVQKDRSVKGLQAIMIELDNVAVDTTQLREKIKRIITEETDPFTY